MILDPTVLKWAGLACCVGALLSGAWLAVGMEGAPLMRFIQEQIAALDQRMRRQLLPPQGQSIVMGQLVGFVVAIAIALVLKDPRWLFLIPAIAVGPTLALMRMQHTRMRLIESRIDGFTLSFANALRATPNIARALETVAVSIPSPLHEELELTLRELRVGSTLEQALSDLGVRIGSSQFDATMSALLIGRRVGGNVPEILNDTATSLREIVRLQSTLRAKTADGRVQALVLAAFPVVIALAFDLLMPGYFGPLTRSFAGSMVLAIAGGSWIAAVILSRKILMVQL
ncbi:MAG TPA: type II secretion system F family protein [Polyangiales bacterium]|nr:type II secretion system F family protein [Polyangiales bacterium]